MSETLLLQPDDKLHNAERYHATRKVTIVGAIVNLILATAQMVGGFLTQSQALIADGVHTLSDLTSDAVVLVANSHAHRQADDNHPYGHGRIETLATSVLGLILLALAGGMAVTLIERLMNPSQLMVPSPLALGFAALAVISKEGLYHYTVRIARRVRSPLLEANAWHHRSDVVSSLVVIVGIIGSLLGIQYFDAIAALAVAGFIGRIGFQLLWNSGQELIDAALDQETLAKTEATIRAIHGVEDMHMLRTRKSGGDAFADVHIQVGPTISVSEGHQIAEAVRYAIVRHIDEITDVTIHIDPEDDIQAKSCAHLPLRDVILEQLHEQWRELSWGSRIEVGTLHYLDGSIDVELIAPIELANQPNVVETLKSHTQANPHVGKVQVLFNSDAHL